MNSKIKEGDSSESNNSNLSGAKKKSPNAYVPSKQRWDSEAKWHGSKVAVWLSPQRAQALWHYAKINRLPALPTEALYHLIDAIGEQAPPNNAAVASPSSDHQVVALLDERLDRFEASTNEALTAISTLLLEILRGLNPDLVEPKVDHGRSNETSVGIPIRQWLDSLSGGASQPKPTLVVAALVLPKSVTISEGVSVCQISVLQINDKRENTQSEYVTLPSLTVHTAVKKEPTGSTLLIAWLKINTWSIELAAVSADGKQKSTLATFDI